MTAMLEAALASLPEDVLARSLGFVRVEELARLSEVSPNARAALGDARRALWFGLFAAHLLLAPIRCGPLSTLQHSCISRQRSHLLRM